MLKQVVVNSTSSSTAANSNHLPEGLEQALSTLLAEEQYALLEQKLFQHLKAHPDWLAGWKLMTRAYLAQGKDARMPAMRAWELAPLDPDVCCEYAQIQQQSGDLQGAADTLDVVLQHTRDHVYTHNQLGMVLRETGHLQAAIAQFRAALALKADCASSFSNLLYSLSQSQDISAAQLFGEHQAFARQFEGGQPHARHDNSKDSQRPLQLGFVCADFRDHAVLYFLEPILTCLSQDAGLSLHAYSNSDSEDSDTLRIRRLFRYWNRVAAMDDDALSQHIRADKIDILIDLSGHRHGNRLLTFARKPAPVQVSWLGYLNSTGLHSMDYYLADDYQLADDSLSQQFSEQLVRLPASAPFMPSEVAPDINGLPALEKGHVTFACFNRPNKITQATVALWAKLLAAVPTARMLLGGMPQDGSYDAMIQWFAEAGIGRERLAFHPRSYMKHYLKLHHEVDLCLDTFPSNGVTTTCHAAWMGVPTLCLQGDRLSSRAAMAVMHHMALDQFVAVDEADFVSKGVAWAQQLTALAEIRQSMRDRFNRSALAQPEMLADAIGQAFRQMWQRWCDSQPAQSFRIDRAQTAAGKRKPIIYVTQPQLASLDEYVPYLEQIWKNKVLTNGGPFHQQLEKALCEYLGVNHLALFSNGTMALLTALQALRISGEVITTPYSFVATSHSLLWNGIKPVFVDIDPVSLNMDPAKIEAAITPQTTAIMPVHCYGHPCDVERIQAIADRYNLRVIYDAAHAFGVQYHGQSVLRYGDLSVLSFHATKVFNTFEGGAIVCHDAKTKQHIDHLKNFGFVDEVTVAATGINGKMSEINAAFGLLQLKGVDTAIMKRKLVDASYRQALSGIPGIVCLRDTGQDVANYSYFPILVQAAYPLNRDGLYEKLRDAGIYARRYFYPLISDFPMYRGLPSAAADNLPVAKQAADQVICLPIYPDLQAEQLAQIVAVIRDTAT